MRTGNPALNDNLYQTGSEKETRNDIELLITVTPELVDAMNPHQVPMGGPGLNSTSPSDCELYLNGHIEVPNMLGNEEHCTVAGDGYSTLHGQPNSFNGSGQMPTAAIIPTAEGVIVGEGVTISAPAQ